MFRGKYRFSAALKALYEFAKIPKNCFKCRLQRFWEFFENNNKSI
jgi:hypothetical protein